MLNNIIERVGAFLTDYLIMIPGAFIRWIVFGKMDFEDYLEDDWEYNFVAVFTILAPMVFIVNSIRSMY